MLSTAHHINGVGDSNMCAPTHVMHPCTLWSRLTRDNYLWLYELYTATAKEYELRYNRVHAGYSRYAIHLRTPPSSLCGPITSFALAMPDVYKKLDPVLSYREYYIGEKARFAKWRFPSQTPFWFK